MDKLLSTYLQKTTTSHGTVLDTVVPADQDVMLAKVSKFVLACYILFMFQPMMPVFSDFIAHTFFTKQHMLMVHEVKGKFHIHQELAKAGNQQDSQKSNELKVEVAEYFNVLPAVFVAFVNIQDHSDYLYYTYNYIPSLYHYLSSPPPETAAQNKISEAISCGS